MASLPPSFTETLAYFARYDYPLTSDELWFWQHGTHLPKSQLPTLHPDLTLRKKRELISKSKWTIAYQVGDQLSRIPFVQAIFVTGSLAMNNADLDADIDFMILTSSHTLWLTRLLVFFVIHSSRRRPQVVSAPNRICDNLYLDAQHLSVPPSLYHAHEVLQAKCVFDRSNFYFQFLQANSWAQEYLPIAYQESIKKLPNLNTTWRMPNLELLFWPLNFILFIFQYSYMHSKMTTEHVGLGFAFFHPKQ